MYEAMQLFNIRLDVTFNLNYCKTLRCYFVSHVWKIFDCCNLIVTFPDLYLRLQTKFDPSGLSGLRNYSGHSHTYTYTHMSDSPDSLTLEFDYMRKFFSPIAIFFVFLLCQIIVKCCSLVCHEKYGCFLVSGIFLTV